MFRQTVMLQFQCSTVPEMRTPLIGDMKYVKYTPEKIGKNEQSRLEGVGKTIMTDMFNGTDVLESEDYDFPEDWHEVEQSHFPLQSSFTRGVKDFITISLPYVEISYFTGEFNKSLEQEVETEPDALVTFEFYTDEEPDNFTSQIGQHGGEYVKRARIYVVIWYNYEKEDVWLNKIDRAESLLYDLDTKKATFPSFFSENDLWSVYK